MLLTFQDLLNLSMMILTNFFLGYLFFPLFDSCSSVKGIPSCFTFACSSSMCLSSQYLFLYVLSLVDPADDGNIFAFIAGLAGSTAEAEIEAEAEAEDDDDGSAAACNFGDGFDIALGVGFGLLLGFVTTLP